MREYKDIISNNAPPGCSPDHATNQVKATASNIVTGPGHTIDPARTAAFLLKSRAIAVEQLRDNKLHIDEISWHILLDLIVATDAGKPVTALDLATRLDVKNSILSRYVDYLINTALIEKNGDGGDKTLAALKPTPAGNALCRDILQKIGQQFATL